MGSVNVLKHALGTGSSTQLTKRTCATRETHVRAARTARAVQTWPKNASPGFVGLVEISAIVAYQ